MFTVVKSQNTGSEMAPPSKSENLASPPMRTSSTTVVTTGRLAFTSRQGIVAESGLGKCYGPPVSHPRLPRGISNLRRIGDTWSAQVSLYQDDAGYFGRRCPDPECHTFFKLNSAEFAAAPQSLQLTCPVCGLAAHRERFVTPQQKRLGEKARLEFGRAIADQVLRDFSRKAGTTNFKGGHLRWTAHKNPPRVPSPLPSYVEQATIRVFDCPRGHHAVIYDLLAFCPWCGADTPPRSVFDDSLAAQRRLLQLVEEQPVKAQADIAAHGGVTGLSQRALTDAVAAIQNLAKQLHSRAGKEAPPDNPWQNVDRLRKRWRASFGADVLDGFDSATIRSLRLAFARRNVLDHNGGVIDADYVQQTGEGQLGRKVRITPLFVEQSFAAFETFADRLEATVADASNGRPETE
jgi:hypothetical protein